MRVTILAIAVACSPSHPAAPEPDAGTGRDAAASPAHGECGMPGYDWVAAATMGDVLEDDPHATVSVTEAQLLRLALASKGLVLHRTPRYATKLHRIRYRTQDRGKPIDATAMVVVPELDAPRTMPVLLFLHGTTGLNDRCAPSANLDDTSSDNYKSSLILSLLASYGYVVVAPDYIGLKSAGAPSPALHPYLVGEATAIASLDSARATRKLTQQLAAPATPGPLAVWGGSQGGHAAAFTVAYAASYAPELEIAAGVYAMPPLDLVAHWRKALTALGETTGFVIMAYTAMAPWYGTSLSPVFVPPLDQQLPQALAAECKPDTIDGLSTIDQIFTAGTLATPTLGDDPWSCIVAANTLATASVPVSSVPALVVLGEVDPIVDPAIERANFQRMCAHGANWSYLECTGAGHGETFAYSMDNALDFIDGRLAGDPITGACTPRPAERCANTP